MLALSKPVKWFVLCLFMFVIPQLPKMHLAVHRTNKGLYTLHVTGSFTALGDARRCSMSHSVIT